MEKYFSKVLYNGVNLFLKLMCDEKWKTDENKIL